MTAWASARAGARRSISSSPRRRRCSAPVIASKIVTSGLAADNTGLSSLLKKVFEVSRWATLIQDPSARRTKDSQPSGFGFEYCASHVRFRVFSKLLWTRRSLLIGAYHHRSREQPHAGCRVRPLPAIVLWPPVAPWLRRIATFSNPLARHSLPVLAAFRLRSCASRRTVDGSCTLMGGAGAGPFLFRGAAGAGWARGGGARRRTRGPLRGG